MRVSPHIQGEAWVAATGRDAPALAPDCGTSLQGSLSSGQQMNDRDGEHWKHS